MARSMHTANNAANALRRYLLSFHFSISFFLQMKSSQPELRTKNVNSDCCNTNLKQKKIPFGLS